MCLGRIRKRGGSGRRPWLVDQFVVRDVTRLTAIQEMRSLMQARPTNIYILLEADESERRNQTYQAYKFEPKRLCLFSSSLTSFQAKQSGAVSRNTLKPAGLL